MFSSVYGFNSLACLLTHSIFLSTALAQVCSWRGPLCSRKESICFQRGLVIHFDSIFSYSAQLVHFSWFPKSFSSFLIFHNFFLKKSLAYLDFYCFQNEVRTLILSMVSWQQLVESLSCPLFQTFCTVTKGFVAAQSELLRFCLLSRGYRIYEFY